MKIVYTYIYIYIFILLKNNIYVNVKGMDIDFNF